MSQFKQKPNLFEAISFDELVKHGLAQKDANIVNGIPWNFDYKEHSISHENDKCYLIPTNNGVHHFTPDDMLVLDKYGDLHVYSKEDFNKTYEPA